MGGQTELKCRNASLLRLFDPVNYFSTSRLNALEARDKATSDKIKH